MHVCAQISDTWQAVQAMTCLDWCSLTCSLIWLLAWVVSLLQGFCRGHHPRFLQLALRAGASAHGGCHGLPGGPDQPGGGVLPLQRWRRCPRTAESYHRALHEADYPGNLASFRGDRAKSLPLPLHPTLLGEDRGL